MGRRQTGNKRKVSIGAKITEEKMRELDELGEREHMNRTELVKAALDDLLRRDGINSGYGADITDKELTDNGARQRNVCPAIVALRNELFDVIGGLERLDVCSSSQCLAHDSIDEIDHSCEKCET